MLLSAQAILGLAIYSSLYSKLDANANVPIHYGAAQCSEADVRYIIDKSAPEILSVTDQEGTNLLSKISPMNFFLARIVKVCE